VAAAGNLGADRLESSFEFDGYIALSADMIRMPQGMHDHGNNMKDGVAKTPCIFS